MIGRTLRPSPHLLSANASRIPAPNGIEIETSRPADGAAAPHTDLAAAKRPSSRRQNSDASPSPPANTEIELKLLADPAQFARFAEAPVIAAHARSRGRVRHLTSVYCDTADGALERSGMTFRLRKIGRRFVQTVKCMPAPDDGPLSRPEWEIPVAGPEPDLPALLPLLPAEVQAVLAAAPLQPVFTTKVRRHARRLVLPTAEVEIAFDQGTLQAGDRTAPIGEIELELKTGQATALYDLALRLADLAPLRPSLQSKAERGFSLAFDRPPAAQKTPRVAVPAAASLDDALLAILRAIYGCLLVNQPAAEDGRDIEGVHQARVALRRLRAILAMLSLLGPSDAVASFRSEAQWLASSLGDARGWDVFFADLLPSVADACPMLGGFAELRALASGHRDAGYATVRAALATPRVGRFQIALGAWIEARGWRANATPEGLAALSEPALVFASHVLSVQHRKVMKRSRHFAALTPEQRHKVRLAVKRLRYSVDFLLPLGPEGKSSRRYVRRLAALQDLLGVYNDMAVTGHLIAALAAPTLSPDGHQALGAVLGWQAHGLAHLETDLCAAVRAFRRAPPPWQDWKLPPAP